MLAMMSFAALEMISLIEIGKRLLKNRVLAKCGDQACRQHFPWLPESLPACSSAKVLISSRTTNNKSVGESDALKTTATAAAEARDAATPAAICATSKNHDVCASCVVQKQQSSNHHSCVHQAHPASLSSAPFLLLLDLIRAPLAFLHLGCGEHLFGGCRY